jgi:AmmeMemoRadiSam system protein A
MPEPSDTGQAPLDAYERSELLRIARVFLKEHLRTGRKPPGAPHRRALLQPSAVFVGLQLDGAPRGSLYRLEADRPLYQAVAELAIGVAREPGFAPLRLEDLTRTRIEVAVLSEPRALADPPRGLEIGRHALLLVAGTTRAFLLPRVATERNLDGAGFLDEACRSAGLDGDAWRGDGVACTALAADHFTEE